MNVQIKENNLIDYKHAKLRRMVLEAWVEN